MRVRYKDSNNVVRSGHISLGPKLPVEYQEVEYIKSERTQFIDTNYYANSNTKVILDVKFDGTAQTNLTSPKTSAFFGAKNDALIDGKTPCFTANFGDGNGTVSNIYC